MLVPQELYGVLRDVARARGTIFYSEVAPAAGVETENPHFGSLVGHHLDEINRLEFAQGRPLLSAVVIGKETNMPGTGFFTCARDLKKYSGDGLAFWLEELRRVHEYWARQPKPG